MRRHVSALTTALALAAVLSLPVAAQSQDQDAGRPAPRAADSGQIAPRVIGPSFCPNINWQWLADAHAAATHPNVIASFGRGVEMNPNGTCQPIVTCGAGTAKVDAGGLWACQTIACTGSAPSPDTQTLGCPAGQTGAVVQTRTYTCSGAPSWTWVAGAWNTASNTCAAIPSATISAHYSPSHVHFGQTYSVVWSSTNATGGVSFSCSNGASGWLSPAAGGSNSAAANFHGTVSCTFTAHSAGGNGVTTASLTSSCPAGTAWNGSNCIAPPPVITAEFSPSVTTVGATYRWTVNTTNATSVDTTCTGAAPGSYSTGPTVDSSGTASNAMFGTTTCTSTAHGPGGSRSSAPYSIAVGCPSGEVWDFTARQCVALNPCPEGTFLSGGQCHMPDPVAHVCPFGAFWLSSAATHANNATKSAAIFGAPVYVGGTCYYAFDSVSRVMWIHTPVLTIWDAAGTSGTTRSYWHRLHWPNPETPVTYVTQGQGAYTLSPGYICFGSSCGYQ